MMLAAMVFAFAMQTPPYSLVIISGNGGVAINNYSSIWRCERARDALLEEAVLETAKKKPKGQAIGQAIELRAFCIPG
ncbi:MAG: hypothetical protein EOP62_15865 [Sphingomonadales bacterium]|nr:MAG: hypothetical protein EOP62_15865 [Sphingomonadales bacterium]